MDGAGDPIPAPAPGSAVAPHLEAAAAGTATAGRRTVVLVEGASDEAALVALARRTGRDLSAEGVSVVAVGGAGNVRAHLERYGPHGDGLRIAGLCDAGEEPDVRRALERAGLGRDLVPGDLPALGFFVCHADLEDELIRAIGAAGVADVVAAAGELRSLRTLQRQPAHQGRPVEAQLRRFMGSRSGRKALYGRLLVEALDLDRTPPPLAGLLAWL
jgi:hypothetical protein